MVSTFHNRQSVCIHTNSIQIQPLDHQGAVTLAVRQDLWVLAATLGYFLSKNKSNFYLVLIVVERLLFAKRLLEIYLAVVPWIEDKFKKLTENGQTKFANMTWQSFWLLHWTKCNSMLLVNNSGLVYEFKKLHSLQSCFFFLSISVIYSNVTENLLLLFPSIYIYLYIWLQAQSNCKTRILNH